jgi:enamine deaminase RidA (YjgF/YER057c/UK114 family)
VYASRAGQSFIELQIHFDKVLETHGMDKNSVVSVALQIPDMAQFALINKEYSQWVRQ